MTAFLEILRRRGKVPVTQETHIEVGEEIARAICSGKFKVTFFLSLGWVMGRSSLPRRSDGSNRRVTGSNGPSKVVGMWVSVTVMMVMKLVLIITKTMARSKHKVLLQIFISDTKWRNGWTFFFSAYDVVLLRVTKQSINMVDHCGVTVKDMILK